MSMWSLWNAREGYAGAGSGGERNGIWAGGALRVPAALFQRWRNSRDLTN